MRESGGPLGGAPRAVPPGRWATSARSGARRTCPACGGPDARPFDPSRRVAPAECLTVRCAACGVVFVDPVPPEAVDQASYGADYYEPWQDPREERARVRLWRRRLRAIERRAGRGDLLDVGCGDGLFLKLARDAGWNVEGIEFSAEGARRAARRLGRPVAVGDLATASGLAGPFDVVSLWHVLEHPVAPAGLVDAARLRLRPGGLLVAAVPNLDNLPMRAAYRLARGRPLPLYERGAREPHLTHFSAGTLRAFLERHGLASIEVRADRCALGLAKRAIDTLALGLGLLCRRHLSDAIVAFARRPR